MKSNRSQKTVDRDAYIDYIHRFFDKWLPVYDLFGFFIGGVYRKTIEAAAPLPNRSLIDVCTGTGEIAIRASKQGARVTAIDVTPGMLEKAKHKAKGLSIKFELADARNLPFPDNHFEIGIISLGLHDMPRPVRLEVLREICRVVSERVIIAEYDLAGAGAWKRLMRFCITFFETSYFRRFATEGLLPLLAEAQLEADQVIPAGFSCFSVYVVSLESSKL